MNHVKPKWIEEHTKHKFVYVEEKRRTVYTMSFIIGYFLSNYCDLHNSFIKWISDELVAQLQIYNGLASNDIDSVQPNNSPERRDESDIIFFESGLVTPITTNPIAIQEHYSMELRKKDEPKLQNTLQKPLSIYLGTGSVRYECVNCGCTIIVPSENQRPGSIAKKSNNLIIKLLPPNQNKQL
jgi:hypothetical protein